MEHLVITEISRSRILGNQNDKLREIKSRTEEQLELIKLQVEALKSMEKQQAKNSLDKP